MPESVRRRCRDHAGDERELREALVEDLRAFVPFSFHVWLLIDPETEVGTAPLATVPDALAVQLPATISARYATRLNRWDTMPTAVESLDRATGGRRSESRLHREVLGPAGVGDVASISFRDSLGCWSFLDLWRRNDAPSFTEQELGALADDAAPITTSLRGCPARAFDARMLPTVSPGPCVMFLAPGLRVIGQTPNTDQFLRALLPTEADRRTVPAAAYNVSAALLAAESGLFDHPPIARARPARGIWLTFAAARIDSERPRDEQDIAVTISASSPEERQQMKGSSRRPLDDSSARSSPAATRGRPSGAT